MAKVKNILKGGSNVILTKDEISTIFIDAANELVYHTLLNETAVRSNKRTSFMSDLFNKILTDNKTLEFEKKIKTLFGTKKADLIVTDNDGISTYVSFMFPSQSINKNKNNNFEHVYSDSVMAFLSNSLNDNYNFKKAVGFIFQPTKTLNKVKGEWMPENVLKAHDNVPFFFEKEIKVEDKINKFQNFCIFYTTNDNFIEAVRNKKASKEIKYVDSIYNINDLYNFYLSLVS